MNAMTLPESPYLYFGNLGTEERQYTIQNFIGLALYPRHDRELRHDAAAPLPFPDNSIPKIQSQDVFEHVPKDKIVGIFSEIFRVLQPGCVFRLSLPDYRSPLLKKRSVYDSEGNVIADLMMGGSVVYDKETGTAKPVYTTDGNAHIWFPVYETVVDLVNQSDLRLCSRSEFYQYFVSDTQYVCNSFEENEMRVFRAPPYDNRAGGRPISIIADFVK